MSVRWGQHVDRFGRAPAVHNWAYCRSCNYESLRRHDQQSCPVCHMSMTKGRLPRKPKPRQLELEGMPQIEG